MTQYALNAILELHPSKLNQQDHTTGNLEQIASSTMLEQHQNSILNLVRNRLRNHDHDSKKLSPQQYVRFNVSKSTMENMFRTADSPSHKSNSYENVETTVQEQQQRSDKKLLHQLQKQRKVLQQQFNIEKSKYDTLYEKYEQLYDITTNMPPQQQPFREGSDDEDHPHHHHHHDEEKKNDRMLGDGIDSRTNTSPSSTRIVNHQQRYHPYLWYCQQQKQQQILFDQSILDVTSTNGHGPPQKQQHLLFRSTPSQSMKALFDILQTNSFMDKKSL